MNRFACLCGILLLCSCHGLLVDVFEPGYGPAPAPSGEATPQRTGRYSNMQQRQSFSPKSSCELREGCYVGDFVLGDVQLQITGAGVGKTVIDGNLVLQTQCVVSNLTVTGNVVFEGNQARLVDVDFLGQIVDHGVQNRY